MQRYRDSKIQRFFLILILILAFFLRVYKIAEYPAGLNADEAAIGYNVYSLIKTGKEEFGHPWPINFQSFNDFKPGLYFYLVLPFVKLFGLNELAVRLPSAILGSLTVLVLYFLVKELFTDSVHLRGVRSHTSEVSLLASFLLAVSPWHLHFSRGGWESNAATFFMILGVYLFFLSLRKPKYFTLFALSFSLSMFTYHSARLIVPLLGLGLLIFYGKKIFIKKNSLYLVSATVLGGVLMTALLWSMRGSAGASRFSGVGIFADQGPIWRVNELRGQHSNPYTLFPKVVHNRYFEYAIQCFDNYLRHFNGDFLFVSGDEIQRNRVPEMGQMYLVGIPFLVLGLYFLIKKRPAGWKFVLWWLAVSPVASALTFQSPHAIRALNMIIPLAIINSYGLIGLLSWVKNKARTIVILLYCYIVLVYLWNFGFYLHQYYVHYPQTYPAAWEYGFKDLVKYVRDNQDRYERIYVTSKYDQPYILFAFYLKYPPERFQKEAKLTPRDMYGFSTVEHFGKYYFGPIDREKTDKGGALVIGAPEEIPDSATIIKRIYFKDGKTEAFRIIEN